MRAVALAAVAAAVCAATYGYAAKASATAANGPSGLAQIDGQPAWTLLAGRRVPAVAILDGGDEAGTRSARDFVGGLGGGAVSSRHGTAVAAVTRSICPACTIVSARVLDGSGRGDDHVIARALVWAVASGARVVNLSMSGSGEAPVLRAAIREATRRGVVIVAAAGNGGSNAKVFPAADPNVIGVAATTPAGKLFSWSNHGTWVSIAAPGEGAGLLGTSVAAPAVTAAAAECLAVGPDLTPAHVRRILTRTATPLDGMPFGGLDVARAVRACTGV